MRVDQMGIPKYLQHRFPQSPPASLSVLFRMVIPVIFVISLLAIPGCTYPAPASAPPDADEPPMSAPAANPWAGTEYIERTFEWTYWRFKDITWEWSVRIPTALYEDYSSRPRIPSGDYTLYARDDGDKEIIEDLASTLASYAASLELDDYETLHFIAAFVQQLEYASDFETTGFDDYARYPVEMLVEQHGDCEDSSILLGKVLLSLGYDVVMIRLPEHMALGIRATDKFLGTHYTYNDVSYFYLETTGAGGRVGMVPEQYQGQPAYIYDFSPRPIITHEWTGRHSNGRYEVQVKVGNHGSTTIESCSILVGFDAGNDGLWNAVESEPFTLAPHDSRELSLSLPLPHTKDTRILIYVVHEGKSVDWSQSQWFGD